MSTTYFGVSCVFLLKHFKNNYRIDIYPVNNSPNFYLVDNTQFMTPSTDTQ